MRIYYINPFVGIWNRLWISLQKYFTHEVAFGENLTKIDIIRTKYLWEMIDGKPMWIIKLNIDCTLLTEVHQDKFFIRFAINVKTISFNYHRSRFYMDSNHSGYNISNFYLIPITHKWTFPTKIFSVMLDQGNLIILGVWESFYAMKLV